jgi:hypothetical protein
MLAALGDEEPFAVTASRDERFAIKSGAFRYCGGFLVSGMAPASRPSSTTESKGAPAQIDRVRQLAGVNNRPRDLRVRCAGA